jgi:hypothetical protein
MKSIILVTTVFLFSFAAMAQIEISEPGAWTTIAELKTLGLTKAKMEYKNHGRDTTYMLFMKDVRKQPEKNYFAVHFKGTDDTFNKFYDVLKSFFIAENRKNKKYMKTFKLGSDFVNIQHYRLITSPGIMFSTNEGHTYFSEKDIDKLFGKR